MKKVNKQTAFARKLRREQTDVEKALWLRLKHRQLEGVKFRRQQPVGPYIVDLMTCEGKLIIELDGGQHNEEEIKARDKERVSWFEERGYRVLRFWNNDVLTNMEGVMEKIKEFLLKSPPSP